MTPPQASAQPHPVWMCVLIAVNQLGFGSLVPVIALYARSFDVTPVGHRRSPSRSTASRASWSRCPPASSADRLGRRNGARARRARHRGRQSPLRVRAELRRLRRRALHGGRGRRPRGHVRPDRPRRHHDARRARPRDGDLPGRLPLRGRHRPAARRPARRALRPARALRRLRGDRASWPPALAWLLVPETRRFCARPARRRTTRGCRPSPRRSALLTGAAGFVLVSLIGFVNAVARTGALST